MLSEVDFWPVDADRNVRRMCRVGDTVWSVTEKSSKITVRAATATALCGDHGYLAEQVDFAGDDARSPPDGTSDRSKSNQNIKHGSRPSSHAMKSAVQEDGHNLIDGEVITVIGPPEGSTEEYPTCIVAAFDVWVGYSTGVVRAYNSTDYSLTMELIRTANCGTSVRDLLYMETLGRVYAATDVGTVVEFDEESQTVRRTYDGHSGKVSALASWGLVVYSAGEDGVVIARRAVNGKVIARLTVDGSLSPITAMATACSSIWCGCEDGTVRVWGTKALDLRCTLTQHLGAVDTVYGNAHFVITGGMDRCAYVWDARTFRCIRRFVQHSARVRCVVGAVGAVHYGLWSSADDGTIQRWNITSVSDSVLNMGRSAAVGRDEEVAATHQAMQQLAEKSTAALADRENELHLLYGHMKELEARNEDLVDRVASTAGHISALKEDYYHESGFQKEQLRKQKEEVERLRSADKEIKSQRTEVVRLEREVERLRTALDRSEAAADEARAATAEEVSRRKTAMPNGESTAVVLEDLAWLKEAISCDCDSRGMPLPHNKQRLQCLLDIERAIRGAVREQARGPRSAPGSNVDSLWSEWQSELERTLAEAEERHETKVRQMHADHETQLRGLKQQQSSQVPVSRQTGGTPVAGSGRESTHNVVEDQQHEQSASRRFGGATPPASGRMSARSQPDDRRAQPQSSPSESRTPETPVRGSARVSQTSATPIGGTTITSQRQTAATPSRNTPVAASRSSPAVVRGTPDADRETYFAPIETKRDTPPPSQQQQQQQQVRSSATPPVTEHVDNSFYAAPPGRGEEDDIVLDLQEELEADEQRDEKRDDVSPYRLSLSHEPQHANPADSEPQSAQHQPAGPRTEREALLGKEREKEAKWNEAMDQQQQQQQQLRSQRSLPAPIRPDPATDNSKEGSPPVAVLSSGDSLSLGLQQDESAAYDDYYAMSRDERGRTVRTLVVGGRASPAPAEPLRHQQSRTIAESPYGSANLVVVEATLDMHPPRSMPRRSRSSFGSGVLPPGQNRPSMSPGPNGQTSSKYRR